MRIWDVEIWVRDKLINPWEHWADCTVVAVDLIESAQKAVAFYNEDWKFVEARKVELMREVDVE
jgi:hypothetical protein